MFGKSKENPMNKVQVKMMTTRKQYLKFLEFRLKFKKEKKIRNGAVGTKKKKVE